MKKRFKRLGAMLLAGTMLMGVEGNIKRAFDVFSAQGVAEEAILPQQEMQQNRKTVHPLRKQGERQVVVTLTHPNM